MEFHAYARILRRRWWLPAFLGLLVGLLSLLQLRPWQPVAPGYVGSVRLLMGVNPAQSVESMAYDPRYYAWLTSEYLVDDFTEVVRSDLFARGVSARLAESGLVLPAGLLRGAADTGRRHRVISLTLAWHDREQLAALLQAIVAELEENGPIYFEQLGTSGALVSLLDGPTVDAAVPAGLAWPLAWLLRLGLGLGAGVGLAFLLHYLDRTVRDAGELEEMGLAVLGELPRHR